MKKIKKLIPILFIIIFVIALLFMRNNMLFTKNFMYKSLTIPKQFNGYKIVHINNIKNKTSGIIGKTKKCKPDLILVTGSLSNNGKANGSIKLLNELGSIAPTYYVLGDNDDSSITSQITNANYIGSNDEVISKNLDISTEDYIKLTYGNSILDLANDGDEQANAYIQYIEDKIAEDSNKTLKITGIEAYNNPDLADKEMIKSTSKGVSEVNIVLSSSAYCFDTIYNYSVDMMLTGYSQDDEGNLKNVQEEMGTTLLVSNGITGKAPYSIQCITLSDGTLNDDNPLEKFLGLFIKDVGTIFDNDGGFQEYRHTYTNEDEHLHF